MVWHWFYIGNGLQETQPNQTLRKHPITPSKVSQLVWKIRRLSRQDSFFRNIFRRYYTSTCVTTPLYEPLTTTCPPQQHARCTARRLRSRKSRWEKKSSLRVSYHACFTLTRAGYLELFRTLLRLWDSDRKTDKFGLINRQRLLAMKTKARTVAGTGEKYPLCDPMVDPSYEREGVGGVRRGEDSTWDGEKKKKRNKCWPLTSRLPYRLTPAGWWTLQPRQAWVHAMQSRTMRGLNNIAHNEPITDPHFTI